MKKLFTVVTAKLCLVVSIFLIPDLCRAQYIDMHDFNGTNGAAPPCTLTLSGSVLYGMSSEGGANGFGNIFSISTNGSNYKDLWDFDDTGSNGSTPAGSLTVSGGVLFGMTKEGGRNGLGTVFSIHTNGSQYTDLLDFNDNNGAIGAFPFGFLTLSSNVLYGMTSSGGGNSSFGNIFSIHTDGTGFFDMFDFNGINGGNPLGSLTLSGSVLYGMTQVGGTQDSGVIFSINTNGTNYNVLFNFNNSAGFDPLGSLIISGGVLYGMTAQGGTANEGTLFSFNPNTSVFTKLLNFIGQNGDQPHGDLILSNGVLYGMPEGGGANGLGCIFSINANGSNYQDLYDFSNSSGFFPLNNLTISGNALYGTAVQGGADNDGVVFKFLLPCTFSPPVATSNGPIYAGSTLDLTASTISGATYSWKGPDNFSSTVQNPVISRTRTPQSGTYSVTATLSGCTSGSTVNVQIDSSLGTITMCPSESFIDWDYGDPNGNLQWYISSGSGFTPVSNGPLFSGATTNDLVFTPPITKENNDIVWLIETDGSTVFSSTAFTIKVDSIEFNPSTITNITCNGGSTGSATVSVKSGTSPYTYSWAPVSGTNTNISNLSAGIYTVFVTDGTGCTNSTSLNITQPVAIRDSLTSLTSPACFGENNGIATIGVKGGTTPYTFTWTSNVSTTSAATNLKAQAYTVSIKDKNGCSQTLGFTVTQPLAVSVSILSHSGVLCSGGNTGSATANSTSGGTSPYSYSWSPNGGTNLIASGLTAGTYTITAKDVNGCTGSASVSITQPGIIRDSVIAADIANISCNGGSNGSLTLGVKGGTTPYTYSWAPLSGSSTKLTGMAAGTYSVYITDKNGCTSSASIVFTQPAAIRDSVVSMTSPLCNGGSNGTATIGVVGGTTPYTYTWTSSVSTTGSAINLKAQAYTVTVKDKNGCSLAVLFTITQPAAIRDSIITASKVNVSCFGGNNGSATIGVKGGTSPYTYSWMPSGGTNATGTGLTAGTYSVTVMDNNGCTGSSSVSLTQPSTAISIGITSQTNIKCNGGTGSATARAATGGNSPYTYSWSPSGGNGLTASGISAGVYTISATDSHGCMATASVNITQPANPLSANASVLANILCYGNNIGNAQSSPSGGTSPYTYLWSNGATTSGVSGLSAGTYSLTVTDNNSCSASGSTSITQPAAPLAAIPSVTANVNCNGNSNGSAQSAPTGGTPPYAYLWSNGATTSTISGQTAGVYTITIADNNNCTTSASVNIIQPAALATNASATDVACFGGKGSVQAAPTGGTSPYTYSWSGGITTSTITGKSPGSYTVTVKDNNGCTASASVTITQPATALAITMTSHVNLLCNGENTGSATANSATGGTSPYTYSWAPGGGTNLIASGLSGGTYSIIATDANGCSASASVSITQPTMIRDSMIAADIVNISCNGGSNGSSIVGVKGGTTPYTYSWAPSSGTSTKLTGITAGTYSVYITDKNGCTSSASIVFTQPAAIRDSVVSMTSPLCNGGSNGTATIGVVGGTTPYTYTWTSSVSTTGSATNLKAQAYTVTVKDKNGCSLAVLFTITQPAAIRDSIITASKVNVNCNGGNNGSAAAGVKGGTSPYTYSWKPSGGTNDLASNLSAGTYTIDVTDANGCMGSASVSITQPGMIRDSMISTDIVNISCNGGSNGSLTVGVKGGVSPYTYSWAPLTGTNSRLSGLSVGTYSVYVTDKNGCSTSAALNLTQPASIRDSVISGTLEGPTCFGSNNGTAAIGVKGGTTPYTYNWTTGVSTTSSATSLKATSYTVTVKDKNGCSLAVIFALTQPLAIRDSIIATSKVNVSCNGENNGNATAGAKFGTTPYTYNWQPNGGTNATASGLSAGTYTVHITDINGCTATASTSITQPTILRDSIVTQSCSGSNGSATIGVKGGTSPYTYSWNPGGGTKSALTGLTSGSYTIAVTDKNGCIQTTTVSFLCSTAPPPHDGPVVPDTCCPNQDLSGIKLYPNPNTGEFSIEGVQPGQIVQLYDYSGQLLKTETAGDSSIILLNISNQANGVYLVRILSKDGALISQKKVVKTQ